MKKLLLVTALCCLVYPAKVSAEIPQTEMLSAIELIAPKEEPKPEPKPIEIIVKEGDKLEKLAKAHGVPLKRLWDKNLNIPHPDLITPGMVLVVPLANEILADRPMPTPPAAPAPSAPLARPAPVVKSKLTSKQNMPGNSYTRGYCTWYAKSRRMDLPNNLGNADTWYARAAAQGYSVGYAPRIGAVAAAISYMHVAIVTGVSGNTVTVVEMNYKGRGIVSSRTTSASEFRYIY